MKDTIELRPFAPGDATQVFDLLQDVSVHQPDPDRVPDLARMFTENANSYACVIVRGERILGFGSLFFLGRIRGGCSAIIEDLVVATDVRGQGVGRRIVENLLVQARSKGCFKVSLEASASARPFYEACGFSAGGQAMRVLL